MAIGQGETGDVRVALRARHGDRRIAGREGQVGLLAIEHGRQAAQHRGETGTADGVGVGDERHATAEHALQGHEPLSAQLVLGAGSHDDQVGVFRRVGVGRAVEGDQTVAGDA
ncbi:MAG: hypothetical protein U5Q44_09940 [Dehalococcoidia bacterium]|nr:hypothetical protein [Dehalococcoidia bacterium]